MEKILSLNEEQNGLKLIQVNDGFVVVDLINKPKVEDWQYDPYDNKIQVSCISYGSYKILFATSNLNLEGVGVIEEKDEILEAIQTITTWSSFKDHPIGKAGEKIENWYKQAQQNLFTEEQVREALIMKDETEMTSFNGGEDYEMSLKYDEDEIIQSLKQKKVEITFENDKPIKCILL